MTAYLTSHRSIQKDPMIAKRLFILGAILGAIAVLPAFAQDIAAPRQHRPIQDRVDRFDGASTSTNWSGYAVLGAGFTSAQASWIVPTAKCATGDQYAAFWVGLDGYNSATVEQTGTDSDCVGKNPDYYAWFEFYPYPSYLISSLVIKPGDRISAKVVYANSQFTVTVEDVTTGKSYSKTAAVPTAQRSSAEWIAEAPCCAAHNAILPLADFGTALFGEDTSAVAGTNFAASSTHTGPIGSFPAASIQQISMDSSTGAKEAAPSLLSSDGASFSVAWFYK